MADDHPDKTIQDRIENAMPPLPEEKREFADGDEITMTTDEQRELGDFLEGLIQQLYDLGFSPNELGILFNTFGHRMNASRYDPYEYDRIALTIRLRETIEEWRDEQDHDVPEREVAETVEEMGRFYRDIAKRESYMEDNNE